MLRRSFSYLAKAQIMTAAEAVSDIGDGAKVLVGGFGVTGQPHVLCQELAKKAPTKLQCVCESVGAPGHGIGIFFDKGLVERVTCSFLGRNKVVKKMYVDGDIEICFTPQGTLAEKIRAGGCGIPAFYARAGAGTWYEEHGFPIKFMPDGKHVDIISDKKETRNWGGHWHCLEESITGDYSLIKAWKADTMGNLVFRNNTINFNKVMATAGKKVIVEVEEIVQPGELDPNRIVVPCIYIDRIVKVEPYKTHIEPGCLHLHQPADTHVAEAKAADPATMDPRVKIARRAAREMKPGMFVNLGVGLPCESADFCSCLDEVTLQGENGMMGIGGFPDTAEEADGELISAARFPVQAVPHASFFGSEEAFGQIRGGHLDLAMLGALQVASDGNLANWLRPGSPTTGMGGAMELVTNSCRVVVTMTHTNNGKPKILSECTLPLTGKKCVDRIITDKAVFDVDNVGHSPLTLVEIAGDTTVGELKNITEAPFVVSPDLKTIEY